MNLRLTAKDLELLDLVSRSGVISFEQAKRVYNSKYYHYNRLIRLEKAGYIVKSGRYIQLTAQGAKVVGGSVARVSPYMYDRYNVFADLILNLDNYRAVPQRSVKEKLSLNRRVHFQGGIETGDKLYLVYVLPEDLSVVKAGQIKAELELLALSGAVHGAALFALSARAMHNFPVSDCRLKELFLLPYPDGAVVLNSWALDEYRSYLCSQIPGPYVRTDRPFAHYETPEAYYTFLVTNDLVKRARLDDYFNAELETKPVHIFCLQEQKEYFNYLYPYAHLRVVEPELPEQKLFQRGGP